MSSLIDNLLQKDSRVSSVDGANPESNPTPEPTPNPTPEPTPNPTPEPTPNPTPNPETSQPTGDVDEATKFINDLLGTEFKTRDEVKEYNLKDRIVDPNEYKEKMSSYQKLQQKVKDQEELVKGLNSKINPLSHFASKDEYIRQQLLIKHPQYDPSVLSRAISADLEKKSPVELVKMKMQLENGDILKDDSSVMEFLSDKYGEDLTQEFEDLPTLVQNKIKLEAKEAIKIFNELKSGIEVPEERDYAKERESEIAELKSKWKPFIDKISDSMDKVAFTKKTKDGKQESFFEFAIDEDFKKGLQSSVEDILENVSKRGIEFSDDNKELLVNEFKNHYIKSNMNQILEAYANDKISKMDHETFLKLHNPKRPNPSVAPKEGLTSEAKSKKDVEAEILKNHR